MTTRSLSFGGVSVYGGYAIIGGVLLWPGNCYAYIDPNIGGWIFQLLFPVLVAIAGVWTVFRQRINAIWDRVFRKRGKKNEP